MRVSVSLSLCTAIVLALGTSNAFAQMNADEIFNRLKAQAGATDTVQAAPGAVTRGLTVLYGEEEPSQAAPAQSVVAVPTAPALSSSVGSTAAVAVPSYTIESAAPASTQVFAPVASSASTDIPSVTVAAPAYQQVETVSTPLPAIQSEPSYIQTPTFTQVATPQPVRVAARADATDYETVDEDKRVDLRIYFEWNSASLKPEAIRQLAELCSAIRRVGASEDNRFKIIGHTDKSGTYDYNLYLSNARAREVKRHLVEECALPADALLAVGEGERQSSPATPSNAPEERRVEIQFVS